MTNQALESTEVPAGKPLTAPQTVHPGRMIEVLMDRPDIDIDKLAGLFDLQLKYDAEIARKAYLAAKAQFSAMAPTIIEDGEADFTVGNKRTNYTFATLAGALSQIRSALDECGLNVSWKLSDAEGRLTVTCYLTHELGHQEETSLSAGREEGKGNTGMNSLQAVKSTTSYLERITLFALLGLASHGDDDDAQTFDEKPVERITEKQAADLELFMQEVKLPMDAMLKHFKLQALADMPVAQHGLAVSMLKNRQKKMRGES